MRFLPFRKQDTNELGITEQLQELIEKRDVSVQLAGATVTVSPRNLDENELGLTLKLPSSAEPRSECLLSLPRRVTRLYLCVVRRQTPQVEENSHADHGVRHAEGSDPDPVGHRSVGLEGVERVATVLLLLRHLHRTGHLPAGEESRGIATIIDHPRRQHLRSSANPLRPKHPGARPTVGLRIQPSQIGAHT